MEWVETTGKSLEEAKDAALDELGVDVDEAEFEVLEEPKQGLFGRVRGEARVRARIRPTRPRPKVERRDRRKRSGKGRDGGKDTASANQDNETETEADDASAPAADPEPTQPTGRRSRRSEAPADKGAPAMSDTESDADADLATHTTIVEEFLAGLVDAFGYDAEVTTHEIDEDTNEVHVDGSDLGLLVGPKGNTLTAVQELSRTVVHRKVAGTAAGRVRIDVAGYRQRRRDALERFVTGVADEVKDSGVQKALEPMNAADRKIVHDTINEIDGVSTVSEGEDPRRRVVIVPE